MADRRDRVAFVTWSGEPSLAQDDTLAAHACRANGMDVQAAPWDRPCNWDRYDAIVLRTTWNYHRAPASFAEWIARAITEQWPLWNPPAVVRWNMHKRYLLDLAARGALIPPTVFVAHGQSVALTDVLQQRGWTKAVVKPAISANAYRTTLVHPRNAAPAQAAFDADVAERDMMVQEFVPEIADGELSLMFFGGRFSHAVRKRPAAGEFRVQESHGGTNTPFSPDPATVDACKRLLTLVPGPTLYARVDGVQRGDAFVVIEIEAIEPSLFIASDTGAAERFAHALKNIVRSS